MILLEVLHWCFIIGFATIFGFMALLGGAIAGIMIIYCFLEGLLWTENKFFNRDRNEEAQVDLKGEN